MSTDEVLAVRQCANCGGSGFRISRIDAQRGGARTCVVECAACALISETLRYRVYPVPVEGLFDRLVPLRRGATQLCARQLVALKIHIKFKWVVPATKALRRVVRPPADGASTEREERAS